MSERVSVKGNRINLPFDRYVAVGVPTEKTSCPEYDSGVVIHLYNPTQTGHTSIIIPRTTATALFQLLEEVLYPPVRFSHWTVEVKDDA